jgi:hypothetical protein
VWTENRQVMTAAAAGRWAGRRGLHDCLAGWPPGWLAAVAMATMSAWLAGRWLSGRRGHGLHGRLAGWPLALWPPAWPPWPWPPWPSWPWPPCTAST